MNLGFEIARLSLNDALQRIAQLQDSAVLPMDEDGRVIEDDSVAVESAREIRLLLQRVLDLDATAFLQKMRELYFHLFSVDHEHYRDLLMQAARHNPMATRDFCLEFLLSEDVLFIDDQENLHDLYDVLDHLGVEQIPAPLLSQLRASLTQPFFRLPSLNARALKFLSPTFTEADLADVRLLFEMDLVPPAELTWEQIRPVFVAAGAPASSLETPVARPHLHLHRLRPEDLEPLRWSVGIEGTALGIALRLLGSMVAAGPEAFSLFLQVSEAQPETAFQMRNFETTGQRVFFLKALDLLREDILREVHHSAIWFQEVPEERTVPWLPRLPANAWPLAVRMLPAHWGEFANPTDGTDFATESRDEITAMDQLCDELTEILRKSPFPSTEQLDKGQALLTDFTVRWNLLLQKIRPRLDVLP